MSNSVVSAHFYVEARISIKPLCHQFYLPQWSFKNMISYLFSPNGVSI